MGGEGFEPPKRNAADLQSAPFGHLGTRPHIRNHGLARIARFESIPTTLEKVKLLSKESASSQCRVQSNTSGH
jgi:hypothetical protein